MKKSEVAKLLAMASAFDNRTVGEANVSAWESVLTPDMRFEDAVEALKAHYASSLDYLRPAHVNQGVTVLRKARLLSVPHPEELIPAVEELELAGVGEREWRSAYYDAAKDGSHEPHVVADAKFTIRRGERPPAQLERMTRLLEGTRKNPRPPVVIFE